MKHRIFKDGHFALFFFCSRVIRYRKFVEMSFLKLCRKALIKKLIA